MSDVPQVLDQPVVFLVDDDESVLRTLPRGLEQYKLEVRAFPSATAFLSEFNNEHGCLVLDLSLPDMNGLELQDELSRQGKQIPIIFITGHGGVPESVKAFRAGAVDFLEKPFRTELLLERIQEAILRDAKTKERMHRENELRRRIAKLTDREHDIFLLLLEGGGMPSSKEIARSLDISHRTVEHHRSRILEKMGVSSVLELRMTVGNVDSEVQAR